MSLFIDYTSIYIENLNNIKDELLGLIREFTEVAIC